MNHVKEKVAVNSRTVEQHTTTKLLSYVIPLSLYNLEQMYIKVHKDAMNRFMSLFVSGTNEAVVIRYTRSGFCFAAV